MQLKHLSDSDLHSQAQVLVREEREILTRVLWHLHEIDRRKLFSAMKYRSLFEYAVKELHYSEDEAYRRISAMKLLRELPEIEEKIDEGRLSLTVISKAQTFFRRSGKTSKSEKTEIIEKLHDKTTREAELTFHAIAPEAVTRPDQVRAISDETVELRFQAPRELEEKIERLKGLLAHKYPYLSLGDLIDKLADLGLEAWNPAREPARARASRTPAVRLHQKRCAKGSGALANASTASGSAASVSRSGVSAADRRDVWKKAHGRCENCQSRFALEVDHRQARALGGGHERANLRLLCRQCNGRQAIEKLGQRRATSWRETT